MLTNPRDAFRGQSRSPNSTIPFPYVRYCSSCAIATSSLRRAVFPIFDFKNVVTLKSGSSTVRANLAKRFVSFGVDDVEQIHITLSPSDDTGQRRLNSLYCSVAVLYHLHYYGRTLSECPCYILPMFFSSFFYGRLSWPNGWTDLHETFTRGRY